jgi:hypothetical protein
VIDVARTRKCVGNPPRQTEDPVAPPCVAYFDGDNFGATYQGVTAEEIRLLIYIDGNIAETGGSKGQESRPSEQYFDLFKPPDPKGEHLVVEGFRGWQRYFNERFQTYNRTVHFFMFFTGTDKEPENRRADAADNFATVKPFAVLTDSNENEVDYVEAMAKKGVLNFGTYTGKPNDFYRSFPKLVWGYQPNIQKMVDIYSTFVCQKVANQPAVLSGNPEYNGQPRKFGMFHTSDSAWPGLLLIADLVKEKVEKCGATIEAEATFPACCFNQDNATPPDYAAQQMADFRQKGITTILWTGGLEGNTARAATAIGYFPEWVVLGDGVLDGNNPNRVSGNTGNFDGHAIVVTPEVYEPSVELQRCSQAFREVNTTRPKSDIGFICPYYRNLFQLFTGIQVAGPRLGPSSVDKGFHAIPPVRSTDPTTPACFYESGDYTCVKDAQFEIWAANEQPPGDNRPGCWKVIDGGKRYLPGEWPAGNINAQLKGNEVCNGHNALSLTRPA